MIYSMKTSHPIPSCMFLIQVMLTSVIFRNQNNSRKQFCKRKIGHGVNHVKTYNEIRPKQLEFQGNSSKTISFPILFYQSTSVTGTPYSKQLLEKTAGEKFTCFFCLRCQYSLSDDFQETLSMIVTYIAISLRLIARLIGLDDITSRSY